MANGIIIYPTQWPLTEMSKIFEKVTIILGRTFTEREEEDERGQRSGVEWYIPSSGGGVSSGFWSVNSLSK